MPWTLRCWPASSMGHKTASLAFAPCSPLQGHLWPPPQCHATSCAGFSPLSLHTPFLPHATPVLTQYLASPHSGFHLYVTSWVRCPSISTHTAHHHHPRYSSYHAVLPVDLPLSHLSRTSQTRYPPFLVHCCIPHTHPPAPGTLQNHGRRSGCICGRNKVICALYCKGGHQQHAI